MGYFKCLKFLESDLISFISGQMKILRLNQNMYTSVIIVDSFQSRFIHNKMKIITK